MNRTVVIGVSGLTGSGKDEVYKALEGLPYHIKRMAFADAMKEELAKACGVTVETINANKKVFRPAMQWWGTEFRRDFGRNQDYWVNALHRGIIGMNPRPQAIVITDVRFANEYEYIKTVGGQVWRVVRPGIVPVPEIGRHSSEKLAFPFDTLLENDGTLEQFHVLVRAHFSQFYARRQATSDTRSEASYTYVI